MTSTNPKSSQPTRHAVLSALTVGFSLLFLLLLGARQITSYDLGYHLAFGETFFKTGKIVDYTPFVYTLPALNTPAAARPAPGPGSWYDAAGHYRFTNSSWLSQLFIYGAWYLGGATGLNLLQLCIIAGLFSMLILAMRRSRLPALAISLALLLTGLIINSRFNMRPELFGYLCIVAQYMLLARLTVQTDKPVPPTWPWVGIMVAVEALCINFHSYFLLGLAITGAVLTEYVLQALKVRFADKDMPRFQAYKKVVSRLCFTLTAMAAACFINPWGWRLVLQPFQTLLYMKKNGIGGSTPGGGSSHPWNGILELRATISGHWPERLSDYAVLVMLIVVGVAVLLQLAGWLLKRQRQSAALAEAGAGPVGDGFRIRWAHLFMIGGMLYVGLQMRRNVGVAALIIVPSALLCITESCRFFLQDRQKSPRQILVFANLLVIVLCFFGGYQVITSRLYTADSLETRFGFGLSHTILPLGACNWLNKYAPEARVWCDFQSSSTLHFFTRPHKDVPILTNTWAYPPEVMALNTFYLRAEVPFDTLADRDKINAVVLRSGWSLPLHRQLAADPQWKMVQVEGVNVLYLRAKGRYRQLAISHEIRRPGNFDTNAFVARQIRRDPSFNRAILPVADTMIEAKDWDLAIDLIETGLKYLPPNLNVWRELLIAYSNREAQRRENKDKRCIYDLMRMKYVIKRMLVLEPGNLDLQRRLQLINRILSLVAPQQLRQPQ